MESGLRPFRAQYPSLWIPYEMFHSYKNRTVSGLGDLCRAPSLYVPAHQAFVGSRICTEEEPWIKKREELPAR